MCNVYACLLTTKLFSVWKGWLSGVAALVSKKVLTLIIAIPFHDVSSPFFATSIHIEFIGH